MKSARIQSMQHQEQNEQHNTPGFEGMFELLSSYKTPAPRNVRNAIYERLEREKESYTLAELQRLYQVSEAAMKAVLDDETREDGLFYCNVAFGLERDIEVAEKKEKQIVTLSEHELGSDSFTATDASDLLRELVGNCCGILGSPPYTSHEEGIIRRILQMLPEEELKALREMSVRNELSSKVGDSTIVVPRNYERAIVSISEELLDS